MRNPHKAPAAASLAGAERFDGLERDGWGASSSVSYDHKWTMVVAVVSVRVVEVAVDEVVDVIAMWYGFMTTAGAMNMTCLMSTTGVIGGASHRIGGVDVDGVLVSMIFVRVVQMAIVQIVDVVAVFNGGVAATGAVLMVVVWMDFAAHGKTPCSLWTVCSCLRGCVRCLPVVAPRDRSVRAASSDLGVLRVFER